MLLQIVYIYIASPNLDTSSYTLAPPFSTQSVQIKDGSPSYTPTENVAKSSVVDKRHCFRMMVWLCAYYDFYDMKVQKCHSELGTMPLLILLPITTGDF